MTLPTDQTDQGQPTDRDLIDRRRDEMMAEAWPVATEATDDGLPSEHAESDKENLPTDRNNDETTVDVCGSCSVVLFNGDTTHLDDSDELATIEATVEIMHKPALGDYTVEGYVRCFVCGDDVIGSHQVTCELAR